MFVFSDPVELTLFSGLHALDYTVVDEFYFKYSPIVASSIAKTKGAPIKRLKNTFLEGLIKNVKYGSLLAPLMTFIYTLSSQNQSVVKQAVVEFLYKGYPATRLKATLSKLLTDRAIEKLLGILATSSAQTYAAALQHISMLKRQKRTPVLEDVAKMFSVSSYELSYMLSVLTKSSFSDSFDKAKNRKPRV